MTNPIIMPTNSQGQSVGETIDGVVYLTINDFVDHNRDIHGEPRFSAKSVTRWRQAGELFPAPIQRPGDAKGTWLIPADAQRVPGGVADEVGSAVAPAAVHRDGSVRTGLAEILPVAPIKGPTLQDFLDHEPAFLTLDATARLTGLNKQHLIDNAPEYGGRKGGFNGSWVFPQSFIRKAAGIDD